MLRMLLVIFLYGAGALWGLTHIVRAYYLLLWNDIFRPAEWARNWGVLADDKFPSHVFCWGVFAIAATLRPWKRRWNLGAFAILGLIVWMWICAALSPYPEIAATESIKATKYLVAVLLASLALVDRKQQVAVLAVLCFSVGTWLAWAGAHAALISGTIEIRMSIPGGQMTDRNDFLVAGTGCLPMLAYFGWHYRGRYGRALRLLAKCMLVASILAFVMSHSRGSLVGLVGLGVFYSAFTGRFWKRSAAAAVVGIFILLIAPESTWSRLETIEMGSEQSEGSAIKRMEHMTTAVRVSLEDPVFGVGPDGFPFESQKYGPFTADPHSIWLKCSSEYGIVGLGGFLLVLIALTRKLLRIARRARRNADKQTEALATALCCAAVGFLMTGTFTSQFLGEYLWAIIGLAGAFCATEELRFRELQSQRDSALAPEPSDFKGEPAESSKVS